MHPHTATASLATLRQEIQVFPEYGGDDPD